ncbi:helix-turn-helix domain-containing protein [Maribacter sp. X9]|uniref:helix-turn-helix domain-containing protein n=1 Tax=Maribacter sp. X9 TaxID=3402159 RepID=UPI003AF38F53
MKINLKYNPKIICQTVLKEQLQKLNVPFSTGLDGEIELGEEISKNLKNELTVELRRYGISIVDDPKMALVERIKQTIDEMLADDNARAINFSSYLADKLNYSYTYMSGIFSDNTFTSLENYVILRKVDFVKDLLNETDLTLTEIAHRFNYSSVAHLSSQFKKTTGLTPSTFQRIMHRKKINEF